MTSSERITARVCTVISMLGMLMLAAPSAAQIYKWTDASGTVHFSDTPPSQNPNGSKVEVRPKTEHRPVAVKESAEPSDESEPADQAAEEPPDAPEAPPEEEQAEGTEDDYGTEEDGDLGFDPTMVDDAARDPAVWYRANSPRNRPGQPIRQPGGRGRRR